VTIDKFGYCTGGAVGLPVLLAKQVSWHYRQCMGWNKQQLTAWLLEGVGGYHCVKMHSLHLTKPLSPEITL
jgi:hypothetical protein